MMIMMTNKNFDNFQGALGRNIFSNHRTSVDDDDIRVANDRNEQHKLADDKGSERLGLLILDYNDDVQTRRRMNVNDSSRRAGKKKKKGRTDKKHIARQVESDTQEEEEVVKNEEKSLRVPDSEERGEEEEVEKKVKPLRVPDSDKRTNEEVVEEKVEPLDSEERENEEVVEKEVKPLDPEERENEEGVEKKVKRLNTEERENEEVVEKKVKPLNSEEREEEEVVEKKVKPLRVPDSEERDDDGDMKSVATQCIADVEKKKVECTKACFWTYEDVCERLSCSMRHNHLTRRSFDIGGNLKESDLEDDDEKKENEEGTEPRAHGKKNKKKHHDKKRIDVKKNNLRMRGEETVENTQVPNAECLLETQQDVEKCIISCRRVQEDVCGQLNCSTRSQKALRKECSYNCRKIFDVNICY
ncbi:cilia- and flagella-associated protein 251-like [Helicoverpa zea]|uniref:cilia- and flagella-associated protein 251-like n=1 Tax=Helicoverpa zea TaxID=7113 RepID=UPI001F59A0A2|nr:cilia- and flagella-associated protein 251-like [Helicoverpa zea]